MIDYRLYLVTARYDYSDEKFLQMIESACKAGVSLVQLREKTGTTKKIYELALKVKKITDKYQLPLIIDDRVDICLAVNASGVHIGDDEMPVDVVRKLLGADKILGVSAKTVARAQAAKKAGASYLGVGAIFPTQTKVKTKHTSLQTLKDIISAVDIPVVAIGGIKLDKVSTFKDIPINGIAVVSGIMKSDNVTDTVKNFKMKLNNIMR